MLLLSSVFCFFLSFLKFVAILYCFCIKITYICNQKGGNMFMGFDLQELVSAFIVLFAVIDIIGSIPIIINLKQRGKGVNAMKATVISFLLLLGFFLCGRYDAEAFSC